jgi:hypothetical protein
MLFARTYCVACTDEEVGGDVIGKGAGTCHGQGFGLPGFRRRTPHNAETAALTAGSDVKATPAATRVLPTLWEGRCVPLTIADDSVATVRSLRLFGLGLGLGLGLGFGLGFGLAVT